MYIYIYTYKYIICIYIYIYIYQMLLHIGLIEVRDQFLPDLKTQ